MEKLINLGPKKYKWGSCSGCLTRTNNQWCWIVKDRYFLSCSLQCAEKTVQNLKDAGQTWTSGSDSDS
jgi:hypothetical protein